MPGPSDNNALCVPHCGCRPPGTGRTPSRFSISSMPRPRLARGGEFEDELLNYRKNGSTFYNRLLVSPIRDDDACVRGFVGVQEDATRRVLAERERDRLLAEVDEFASIVAQRS